MKLALIFILFFAISSGVATFIENDYGIETSWALVYGSWWFELIQIILGFSIVFHIFKHKMYNLKKLPLFIFHVAFLFILVGAGITRYYGYEGGMHIREGQTENRILSNDAYLQVGAKLNSKNYYNEEKIFISRVGKNKFESSLDVDGKTLHVRYKKLIKNAKKTLHVDSSALAAVSFSVATPQGEEEHFLKSGSFVDIGPFAVYFDKDPHMLKPSIRLISSNKKISFVSNVNVGEYINKGCFRIMYFV